MINLSIIIPIYKESRNIQQLAKDITNYIDIKNYETRILPRFFRKSSCTTPPNRTSVKELF